MHKNATPLTAAQVSAETGVPKRTILAAIARGALPATKLPGPRGAYLLDAEDVKRYFEERAAQKAAS